MAGRELAQQVSVHTVWKVGAQLVETHGRAALRKAFCIKAVKPLPSLNSFDRRDLAVSAFYLLHQLTFVLGNWLEESLLLLFS